MIGERAENDTSTENNGNKNRLTDRDLWKVFLHQLIIRGINNYERQQNAGFTEAVMPVIEEYYGDPEEKKEAYARHVEYFLTNDITSIIPAGVAAVVERRYVTEDDVDPDSISAVKAALTRLLVGLGNSPLNGMARPTLAGIVISLITAGLGRTGSMSFVIGISVVLSGIKYLGVFQGYKQGVKFVEKIQPSGLISRTSELAATAAYVIVGGFAPALMVISVPIVYQSDDTVFSTQETLDGLMPGTLGISYIGFMYLPISKKKISAVKPIPVTMIMSIMGAYCGILG